MILSRIYGAIVLALLLALGVSVVLALKWRGDLRALEAKIAKDAFRDVSASVEISRQTAERVDTQGEQVRQRARQAEETIDEAINREPVAAGVPDPVVMREASEAHAAALRAHCRVQPAGCKPDPAASAE